MLYIGSMLYVASLHNHARVASGMYHIVFIKTENKVVDEMGRIICSHLLAHAYTYFKITLWFMHDTATYNIVAINSIVQYSKSLNLTLHISPPSSVGSALGLKSKGRSFEPAVNHYFFFQPCSLVGTRLYTWRPAIWMTDAWRIK